MSIYDFALEILEYRITAQGYFLITEECPRANLNTSVIVCTHSTKEIFRNKKDKNILRRKKWWLNFNWNPLAHLFNVGSTIALDYCMKHKIIWFWICKIGRFNPDCLL